MDLTFAHYRNRFCMFRTYYALAIGKVKPDGFDMKVIELPDPPSHEQEEALIRGDVQVANIYLPNFSPAKTSRRADHRSVDGMEIDHRRATEFLSAPTARCKSRRICRAGSSPRIKAPTRFTGICCAEFMA